MALQDLLKNKKKFLLFCITLALAILGIYGAAGYTALEIPILLKEKKLPDFLTSIDYSISLFTYTLGCLLIFPFFKRYSSQKIFLFTLLGFLSSFLIFAFTSSILFLVIGYAIQRLCSAIIFIIFSNIVTTVSNYQKNKGVFTGFFVTLMSLGIFLGAAIFQPLKIKFFNPWLLLLLLTILCSFPMVISNLIHRLVDSEAHDIAENPTSPLKSIKNIIALPVCFFAIMIFGINNNIILGLTPLWILDQANRPENVATLTSSFLLGGILLVSLFSSIISHISFLKTALIYFSFLIISFLIVHIVSMHSIKINFLPEYAFFLHIFCHPFLLIIAGLICSFQSLYFCILSENFKGAALIGVCAIASFLQHLIGAITSPFSGYVMSMYGYRSLGLSLISLNLIFFTILLVQLFLQKKAKAIPSS